MSRVRVVRWSEGRTVPWKNGGGETVEIAVAPPDSDFATFDWRLSSALVAQAGPFSSLPGIDRTLCVTSAGTLRLVVEGVSIPLDRDSPPHAFAGEAAVAGALPDGPVRDLNVMTRRGRIAHRVEAVRLAGSRTIAAGPDLAIVFVADGTVDIVGAGLRAPLRLGTGDTLLVDGVPSIQATAAEARLVVARLSAAGPDVARPGVESAFP